MDKNLVYDVGMNDGTDTERYLELGYTVIAIEADTELCLQAEQRFASEIGDGRLYILNCAIAKEEGLVYFWVNRTKTGWSPTIRSVAERQGGADLGFAHGMRFGSILKGYGSPFYLKVDIEGSDFLCLEGLWEVPEEDRPTYVSVEASDRDWFPMLPELGYTHFALVDQVPFNPPDQAEESSGPFPTEIEDWVDFQTLLSQWEEADHEASWFDVYAARL